MGAALPLEAIVSAFRTGEGVSFAEYGTDLRQGLGALNRPLFMKQLGDEYLPSIPDIHRRLSADPSARVADVGCGTGWSSIGMAKSYPKIHVDGFDLDPTSVKEAQYHSPRRWVFRTGYDLICGMPAIYRFPGDMIWSRHLRPSTTWPIRSSRYETC